MVASIRTFGFPKAIGFLKRIADAAVHANGPIISLTNIERYAYGIETGRTRSGRRARRAGGAYMYRDGIKAMQPKVRSTIAQAVVKGPSEVDAAKRKLNNDAVGEVVKRTPKRSGALRAGVRPSGRSG